MTFAKGFTSSILPKSGVAVSREIKEYFQENILGYGSTYQCHPVSAAWAIQTIEYIENNKIIENVCSNETYIKERMTKISKYPMFRDSFRLHGFLLVLI